MYKNITTLHCIRQVLDSNFGDLMSFRIIQFSYIKYI